MSQTPANTAEAVKSVPISGKLGRLLDVIFGADLPVLLSGTHGIGKSQYLEQYAERRGWDCHVLDLSLLEATDLTGLPYREGGLTRFAPPASLPQPSARPALLVLEELNRCDRSVRQPCLQLLTTRRLNDYRLPPGCRIAACVNPSEGGYDVDALDPALASRFVTLPVVPDREAWIAWAREARLFPGVVHFVERFPQAFDRAPPRTWAQAARLVESGLRAGWRLKEMEAVLAPVLKPMTAKALMMELPGFAPDITAESFLLEPRKHLKRLQDWRALGRVDLQLFMANLVHQALAAGAPGGLDLPAVGELLATMPPDIADPILEKLRGGR